MNLGWSPCSHPLSLAVDIFDVSLISFTDKSIDRLRRWIRGAKQNLTYCLVCHSVKAWLIELVCQPFNFDKNNSPIVVQCFCLHFHQDNNLSNIFVSFWLLTWTSSNISISVVWQVKPWLAWPAGDNVSLIDGIELQDKARSCNATIVFWLSAAI